MPVPHDHNFLASVAEDRRQADLKADSPLEKFKRVWAFGGYVYPWLNGRKP